jgi:TRAP-type uncharacterized transport system fused permease subunit
MGASNRKRLHRINTFLWVSGIFALGYLTLRLADLIDHRVGMTVALCLLLPSVVWIVYWALRRRRYNRSLKIRCKKCGAVARVHDTNVVANPENSRPDAIVSHYCVQHRPKIKLPKGLEHYA